MRKEKEAQGVNGIFQQLIYNFEKEN